VNVSDARAQSSSKIRLETVSDYTLTDPSGNSNTDANTEGDGFWSKMTVAGTGYSAGSYYKDSVVWDRDFLDPQYTGSANDDDTYTDAAGTGIAVYILHGSCNDITNTTCTSDAQCTAGTYCPGNSGLKPGTQKVCIRQSTHSFLTASASDAHGHAATYGQAYGSAALASIAWGEDAASGGFAGAGTNGGANVVVAVNSCGFRSRYLGTDTINMFAGMHSLLGAMPTNAVGITGTFNTVDFSDTAQWSERGTNLATFILANFTAPVGDAWLNPTMTSHGFNSRLGSANADGANFIVSKDASLFLVQWHTQTESWWGAQVEANDSVGLGYWWWRWGCNYNCLANGM
jgi:hypothetical protein